MPTVVSIINARRRLIFWIMIGVTVALTGCENTSNLLNTVSLKPKQAEEVPKENPYLVRVPKLSADLQNRFDRAVALMAQGQWAAAESAWRDLAVQLPDASGVDLNLAICLMNQGELAPALKAAEQGIAKNPKNVELFNRAGLIARAMGDFKTAKSFYEQGLAQWSGYPPLHVNMGILLELYQGELELALEYYQSYQALLSAPDPKVSKWILDLQRRVDAN